LIADGTPSLLLVIANAMPAWEVRVAIVSELMIGACCAALAFALAYLARRFKDLPIQLSYLPFGSLLVLGALVHFSLGLGLFQRGSLVHLSLLALTAMSALGTVALLRGLVRRLSQLADRERDRPVFKYLLDVQVERLAPSGRTVRCLSPIRHKCSMPFMRKAD